MRLTIENGLQKLVPGKEGNFLLAKEDLEKPEEERYYFEFAYVPAHMTLAKCEELYIEETKNEQGG